MQQELTTLRRMVDTRSRPVGGAKDFDARPVRKEERPELENVVISCEGLRRRGARSADTGDEERREPEAADLCDASST